MAETNVVTATQQLISPGEGALKDRRAEEIDGLKFKFRAFRWVLFAALAFALFAAFRIVSLVTRGYYQLNVPAGIVWTIFIIFPFLWYGSHCLKFIRAWENGVVFRLGNLLVLGEPKEDTPKSKEEKSKPEEQPSWFLRFLGVTGERVRRPGATWIWAFLDRIAFIRIDQQVSPPLELFLLCGSKENKLEVTVKAFFIFKVKDAAAFLVNISRGVELLRDMVEAGIGSVVGGNEFETLVEGRDILTDKLKKIINNRINDPEKAPTVSDSDFTLKRDADKEKFFSVTAFDMNKESGWGLEVLQIRIKDIDPREDVLTAIQGVIKAEKEGQSELQKARGQAEARRVLADIRKYELEQEGEGQGALIAKQGQGYSGSGGERVYGAKISETIKPGDKTIIMSLGGIQDEALLTKAFGALAGGMSVLKGDKKE